MTYRFSFELCHLVDVCTKVLSISHFCFIRVVCWSKRKYLDCMSSSLRLAELLLRERVVSDGCYLRYNCSGRRNFIVIDSKFMFCMTLEIHGLNLKHKQSFIKELRRFALEFLGRIRAHPLTFTSLKLLSFVILRGAYDKRIPVLSISMFCCIPIKSNLIQLWR